MSAAAKHGEFSKDKQATAFPFRELVGSLMCLENRIRPDISNAVRAVARYCASPKLIHWRTVLGTLGYVWPAKSPSTISVEAVCRGYSF